MWEAISAVAAVAATLFAAWAANEARRAVVTSQKAAEAALLIEFLREYDQDEMANALRLLGQWRAEGGENFAQMWIERRKENDPEAQKVDAARRKVYKYFQRAVRLRRIGFISDPTLKCAADQGGRYIFLEIVHPLNRVLDSKTEPDTFNTISSLGLAEIDTSAIQKIPPVSMTN